MSTKSRKKSDQPRASARVAAKPAAKQSVPAAGKTSDPIAIGDPAPSFTLTGDDGRPVLLSDFAGGPLVLFFYPRANTPGCTREAVDFTASADAFAQAGARVLGVSADTPKVLTSFRSKHDLTIALASDTGHSMLQAYGAWGQKSMYGKTFEGILRTTFLIDRDGKVARVWRNVKVEGHATEVLEAARQL